MPHIKALVQASSNDSQKLLHVATFTSLATGSRNESVL